jgi:hypothetical protein
VNAVFCPPLYLVHEIKVQVNHVQFILVHDLQQKRILNARMPPNTQASTYSGRVRVGFEHVLAQFALAKLDLGNDKAALDVLGEWQRGAPDEERLTRQDLDECFDAQRQVVLVVRYGVGAVSGQVPDTAVHDDDVGLLRVGVYLLGHRQQIVRVAARDEVELDEVKVRLVFAHLPRQSI